MNTTERELNKSESKGHFPLPEEEHGLFNSSTVRLEPDIVFDFCQKKENVEKVLADLPMGIDNFLDLTFVSAERTSQDQYEIKWKNKPESKVSGTLSFLLQKAPVDHGTILIAEAIFDNYNSKGQDPSDLMKIFLKRMKALLETGVIATTKGQPSGRDELKTEDKTLH